MTIPASDGSAAVASVAALGSRYNQARYAADPIAATIDGVPGHDSEMPDPSRDGDGRYLAELAAIAAGLDAIDDRGLRGEDRLSRQTLGRLLHYEREARLHALGEVAISASVAGTFPAIMSAVPAAAVATAQTADEYLTRLGRVGEFFDRLGARHEQAITDGRVPTEIGVRQALAQLDAYLSTPLAHDPLLQPTPGADVDVERWRAQAAAAVRTSIRPALARYRETLAAQLLPVGRGDDRVGVCHIPGGAEGYQAAVRAHTTTDLTPEEIHHIGVELVATLRDEFADRGARALGTHDVAEVLRRLRDDPALRFGTGADIVSTVTDALRRAEAALPDWFRPYQIAACTVGEMDMVEAENSVPGYYLPPAADGSRPGTHVVNTWRPHLRPRYEYEALAFHESVPGHHLQIALAQSLTDLPDFRRFAYLTAHGEGWGLYVERLCDEMGLYSDDMSRLGMVSFDAWRACRLVVDTGMHHLGWTRQQAIDYLLNNTALSELNIANEVDRYIADPGQALGYMIGRIRIRELRDRCQTAASYDIKAFHHEVLGHGSLPLDVLDDQLAQVFPPR